MQRTPCRCGRVKGARPIHTIWSPTRGADALDGVCPHADPTRAHRLTLTTCPRDLTDGEIKPVYDAALAYRASGVPLLVIAGKDYGTGSSRDWAAKGPALRGVRAVLAESFERIHRSNLVGMGILPLQFRAGESAEGLGLTGRETYTVTGLTSAEPGRFPRTVTVDADRTRFEAILRLDTHREQEHIRHSGIMRYVLRTLLNSG